MPRSSKITTLQSLSLSVEEARATLSVCRDATELITLVAKGQATVKYLRDTLGASEQAVLDASEITLWASRRLGEVLRQQPKHQGGRPSKTSRAARQVSTLAELGLSRDKAAKLQALAAVPKKEFAAYVASAREAGIAPTLAAALRSSTMNRKATRVAPPVGLYDVVVIDPPWPTKWSAGKAYPTMEVEEIAALDVPVADSAWVFLWATQRFLPDAMRIIEGWGLEYGLTLVWKKTGHGQGFKPWGSAKYNCEFCVVARKGSPTFADVANFSACFDAPMQGHSVKPDEFYSLLRRVTAGRRLDMFNRRRIEGFDGWGDQSPTRVRPLPRTG